MSGLYGDGLYGGGLYGYGTATESPHFNALRQLFPVKDGMLTGVYQQDVTIEASHLDNAYTRSQTILPEFYSDTTVQLLSSWERIFGLTASGSTSDRQNRITAKLRVLVNKSGRLTKDYYLSIMLGMGHPEAYILEGSQLAFIVAPSPNASILPHAVFGPEASWIWEIHATVSVLDRPVWENVFSTLRPAFTLLTFVYF